MFFMIPVIGLNLLGIRSEIIYLILLNDKGEEINLKYLQELLKLQDSKGLHLANKLKQAHIFFGNQKKKVRLATRLLSKSVADALLCCKDTLKLPEFSQCSATVTLTRL